jgi:hypothetical protein
LKGRNLIEPAPTKFSRNPIHVTLDGFTISKGDLIKIRGEYGVRFRFDSVVTNLESGAEWIDCYEMFRGNAGALRSFRSERIKRIPKKRTKK